jgi:hypothetical protein
MSARLAEPCRPNYLKLEREEIYKFDENKAPLCTTETCDHDIFIGVFFDGTNNNKYRDMQIGCTSSCNNARLFEAYKGHPATPQKAMYGGKESEAMLNGLPDSEKSFHRKIYIPGLGTGFAEINDPGEKLSFWKRVQKGNVVSLAVNDKTGGLAMALHGEARIRWALMQVLNQVSHSLLQDTPIIGASDLTEVAINGSLQDPVLFIEDIAQNARNSKTFEQQLHEFDEKLTKELQSKSVYVRKGAKYHIRRIRLSVFGFSRGAASARAFVNRLVNTLPGTIGSIKYEIDFLGLFDTVASVGIAGIIPGAEGHMAWADGDAMVIPERAVKRCVHLVSAHEVRRSFPLDSISKGEALPGNSKEIVYPGVHSDVGGGYPVQDQGRCTKDTDKISQITLAQMYREALMAGVPLALPSEMRDEVKDWFSIDPEVIKRFNAYIEVTRKKVAEEQVTRDDMHLTETQPAEPLFELMHKQYRYYLAWRKYRLDNIHQLPGLTASTEASAKQDIHDIWQTNNDLKSELCRYPHLAAVTKNDSGYKDCYDFWTNAPEANLDPENNPDHKALVDFFDLYVHDSRAWFKLTGDSDDEWFGTGKTADGKKRKSNQAIYQETLEAERARLETRLEENRYNSDGDILKTADQARLDSIKKEQKLYADRGGGKPLIARGEPMHEMLRLGAGYLRWRKVFTTDTKKRTEEIASTQYETLLTSMQIAHYALRAVPQARRTLQAQQDKFAIPVLDRMKSDRDSFCISCAKDVDPEELAQFNSELDFALGVFGESRPQSAEVKKRIAELRMPV